MRNQHEDTLRRVVREEWNSRAGSPKFRRWSRLNRAGIAGGSLFSGDLVVVHSQNLVRSALAILNQGAILVQLMW